VGIDQPVDRQILQPSVSVVMTSRGLGRPVNWVPSPFNPRAHTASIEWILRETKCTVREA
jgi:hypothetical protein